MHELLACVAHVVETDLGREFAHVGEVAHVEVDRLDARAERLGERAILEPDHPVANAGERQQEIGGSGARRGRRGGLCAGHGRCFGRRIGLLVPRLRGRTRRLRTRRLGRRGLCRRGQQIEDIQLAVLEHHQIHFRFVQAQSGEVPAPDQRLHVGELEFQFGDRRHRRPFAILQHELVDLQRAAQGDHRRRVGRLAEGDFEVGGEQRRWQLEARLDRQVGHPRREVELLERDIDDGLLRFGKGLGAGVEQQRIAVERRVERRLHEDVHPNRQIGDEGHAEPDLAELVLEAARLVLDRDMAVADADVADREQRRGRILRRSITAQRLDALEHVGPVVLAAFVEHQLDTRGLEREFVQHDALAHDRLDLEVGAQGVEGQRLATAVCFHHPQAAHLGGQPEGVDEYALDADFAPEDFAEVFLCIVPRNRRGGEIRHGRQPQQHARSPQCPTHPLAPWRRGGQVGRGIRHKTLQGDNSFLLSNPSRSA